jgi:hypothetical protein
MDRQNINEKSSGFYKGSTFQKGSGIGDQFRRFFKWIVPKITPLAKKGLDSVKKELLNSAANIAKEIADGNDVKSSFVKNYNQSIDNIKEMVENKIGALESNNNTQSFEGKGIKRKNKKFTPFTIFQNKKQRNIFTV